MTSAGPLVLLVEDEVQMRRFLRASLQAEGYRLVEAENAAAALRQATTYNPDIVLLDLGLPDGDGLEVLRRLREWSNVPVIVLSARDREQDKVEALDGGADDYLTKPFGSSELLARMRVAMRHGERAGPESQGVLVAGDLELDLVHRRVFRAKEEVRLTPTEYKLFALLMRHPGKVLTHRHILTEVWGPNRADQTQYLRVYMLQLRHKLEAEPARPKHLVTEAGVGYRLRVD